MQQHNQFEKHLPIWRLLLNEKLSYRQIQDRLKVAPKTIAAAVKAFKKAYPTLKHLLPEHFP